MAKWRIYKTYENWVESERSRLECEYKDRQEKYYDPVIPDTYCSFDDFCMGQWQSMD